MIGRLLKDSVIYGLAGVASAFVGFFLTPLYTRWFQPEEYAILDLLIGLAMIFSILFNLRIDASVARNFYNLESLDRKRKWVGTSFILSLSLVVIGTVFVGLCFKIWLNQYFDISWTVVLPMLLILIPRRIHMFSLEILRLQHKAKKFAFLSVGNIILSALLSIVSVALLNFGIAGVLWSLVLSRIAWSIVGLVYLQGEYTLYFDSVDAKEMLRFGIPLLPAHLNELIQSYANRFIIIAFLGLVPLGIYSLGLKLAGIVTLFAAAFIQALVPVYNKMLDQPDSGEKYVKLLNFYLFVTLGICSVVTCFAKPIVILLSTPDYYSAAPLIGYLTLGLMWGYTIKIVDAGMSKMRKTYWVTIGTVFGWIFQMVMLVLTIGPLGIHAASLTYLVTAIVTFLIILFFSQRLHHIPYNYYHIGLYITSSLIIAIVGSVETFHIAILGFSVFASDIIIRILIFSLIWLCTSFITFIGKPEIRYGMAQVSKIAERMHVS